MLPPSLTKRSSTPAPLGATVLQFGALFLLFSFGGCTKKSTVVGRVTDRDGRPLPGTHVEAIGTGSQTTTDQAGAFRLPCLPGKLTLRFQHSGQLSKSVVLNPPRPVEYALPTVVLNTLPTNAETATRLRVTIASLSRDSSAGPVRFDDRFTVKELVCEQVLPGDDRYTAAVQLTLVSKHPFSWGQADMKASVRTAAFTDVVGGFEARNYPPGYTFTRALRATIEVASGADETLSKLEAAGQPGTDILPPSRDFSTFIVGQWNGGPMFDFHADGTWSMQNSDAPADSRGRRWSVQGDTLTMVEPSHVTRYTKLSVQGQQLTIWNQGPLTLTRIQSVVALNVAPIKTAAGVMSPTPTPSAISSTPSPSPSPHQTNATPTPTIQPTNTPKKRGH